MRETIVENRLVRGIREMGGLCRKYTSPGQRGVPDRLCFLPGGRLVLVELKAPGWGAISTFQAREFARLQARGFAVEVVTSVHEVDALLERLR